MNQKFIKVSMFIMLTSILSYGQEKDSLQVHELNEVVVSDTKFAQSKEKSGKVIEVITAEDLKAKQGQNLASILSQVAGIEVNGNQSANGKNQGIYIRGGRNRQVAIYIDGVPVVDASGINLEYDLRLIPTEQIEQIEILKGSSSVLYGTGAATGVINITLKKSAEKSISGNAYWNLGTQNDSDKKDLDANAFSQGISVNGRVKKFSYLTSINSTETKGFSEAKGENFEEDTFSRVNVLQKVGFQFNDKLSFDVFGNYDAIRNTFDNPYSGPMSSNDDLNNRSFSEQFRLGIQSNYKYAKGELNVNVNGATIEREIYLTNTWAGGIDVSEYSSRNANFDVVNKYNFSNQIHLITGLQTQYYDMEQFDAYTDVTNEMAHFNSVDPYATIVYNSDFGLNINAGGRLNIHSDYGNHFVYNVNPSYNFASIPLKLLASYSTAYITPSLYQLFGPYGNIELQPEENATAEFGFETKLLSEKIIINAVGFYRNEVNKIDFFTDTTTWTSFYDNFDNEINAKGFETNLTLKLTDKLITRANYTFTEVETEVSRYIPKHKVNTTLQYAFSERLNASVDYQYLSERNEAFYNSSTFGTESIELDSYSIFNANLNYKLITNRLSVFGSVTNILNEEFVEAIGYNTRGRNFKLGLSLNF